MKVHLTQGGRHTLCGNINQGDSIHVHYADQAISQGLTVGELCESCTLEYLSQKVEESHV